MPTMCIEGVSTLFYPNQSNILANSITDKATLGEALKKANVLKHEASFLDNCDKPSKRRKTEKCASTNSTSSDDNEKSNSSDEGISLPTLSRNNACAIENGLSRNYSGDKSDEGISSLSALARSNGCAIENGPSRKSSGGSSIYDQNLDNGPNDLKIDSNFAKLVTEDENLLELSLDAFSSLSQSSDPPIEIDGKTENLTNSRKYWNDCSSFDGHLNKGYPLYADGDDEVACHVMKVDRDSSEFKEVAASIEQFQDKPTGLSILSCFRIQNEENYAKFQSKSRLDHKKHCKRLKTFKTKGGLTLPSTELRPRELFHVTRAKSLESLIVEGLDQRLASRGRFGRGLYFAEDPCKSDMYWRGGPQRSAVRMMLRANVLMGRVKKYARNSMDPSLLREPKGYDSVVGDLCGTKEFVVYDSDRIHLDYIITYQASSPKQELIQVPLKQELLC